MATKKAYKSDAFEAIQTSASALHKIGAIDKAKLNKFETACCEKPIRKPVQQAKLSLTPEELDIALKLSADRRQRLAAAFGLKVPGYKLVKINK
jgi:hypothetical protein